MKRLEISLYLLICIPFYAVCQEIKVSEEVPIRNAETYELIGRLNDKYLVLFNRPNKVEVQSFSLDLETKWEKELELDKRLPEMVGVDFWGDDFYLFYQHKNKGRTHIKAHRYNSSADLLDSVTINVYGNVFFTPDFKILRSEDRTKVIIYYVERMKEINAVVFDIPTMTTIAKQTIVPEDMDFNFEFLQAVVNNNGDFAFIIGRDNFKSKRKDHYYDVYQYIQEENRIAYSKVILQDLLTFDVLFYFDNQNDFLVGAGFYADKTLLKAQGYFLTRIPIRQPEDYQLYFQGFNDEFVNKLLGKEKKKNQGITEASVMDMVLRRDGGVLLIGEKTREFQRRTVGPSARTYYDGRFMVDYYFEDIFIISIHPNGEEHWKTVLPKKQFSQDDFGIYSSFFLFKSPTSIKLLFNDEIKNENTVSEYELSGNGEYIRNSLMSTQNLQLKLRFRDALQINSNEILIPSEKKSRVKLVTMKY